MRSVDDQERKKLMNKTKILIKHVPRDQAGVKYKVKYKVVPDW